MFLNCQFGYDISCQIVCENGVIDLPKPPRPLLRRSGGQTIPLDENWKNHWMRAYDLEIQQWIDAVRAGELTGPNAWDGVIANVTADALLRAQQNEGQIEPIAVGPRPDFYK